MAQHIVETGLAPAVNISILVRRSDGWSPANGFAGRALPASNAPITADTVFDLASLTKPFVAMTCAYLAGCSKLKLTEKLGHYLPELNHLPISQVSVERALSHRAGLKPHRVLYGSCVAHRAISRPSMLRGASEWTTQQPSPDAVYSDLGYLIAGAILERIANKPLDLVVDECLLRPLDLPIQSSRQWQIRSGDFLGNVAPSEHIPWRGGTLRGVVHDENAWAWAGHGIAGHAGLFGTAAGVARFGVFVLDSLAGRASPISRFMAHFCTALRPGGQLRAGFDGVSPGCSSAGSLMSRNSFGHLGFTGTSLWCDPENEIVISVLTNRVNPTRNNTRLPLARAAIHDELFQWARLRQV